MDDARLHTKLRKLARPRAAAIAPIVVASLESLERVPDVLAG